MRKEYVRPGLDLIHFTLRDAICSSPETLKSVVDDGGDWGDDDEDNLLG